MVALCARSSSTPSSHGDVCAEKTPILFGRRLHGQPVELFCKEFQDFVSNVKKVQVDKDDLQIARQMQKEMSKKFDLETERAELFRDLFGKYINEKLVISTFPGKQGRPPNTDGSIIVTSKNEEMALLNLEVKNELGKW